MFITDDIRIEDVDFTSLEAENYELTEDIESYLEFVKNDSKIATEDEKKTAESFLDVFPQSFGDVREWIDSHTEIYEEWTDQADERYTVPMMYAIRFYPSFVSFEEEDRYRCSGSTCLVYDSEGDRWGVGMSGGGMDLCPHLVDTFISLGKGVPSELASSLRLNYNAYVNGERHKENCKLIAEAYLQNGLKDISRVRELVPETGDKKIMEAVDRHKKGLELAVREYINIPF